MFCIKFNCFSQCEQVGDMAEPNFPMQAVDKHVLPAVELCNENR